jgi:ribonuclease P protein component
MKRRYRLRKNSDFQRVRHLGRSEVDRLIVLIALSNGLGHSRFGFAVSKRIGKAVKRSKIRRRMREATRLRQSQIKPGWDVLLIARVPIRDVSYQETDRSICRLLKKMDLLLAQSEGQE